MSDVVIAPFSNSAIRDWPAGHYDELIKLLLLDAGVSGNIRVIGTAGQRLGGCEIVRRHPADRVINECGRLPWGDVLDVVQTAACVIGNNSGIAHVAGEFGVPTVCIFGGSHHRFEWRPRGRSVIVLSRAIGCSPCHLDHRRSSPYGKACLTEISPAEVRDAVFAAMSSKKPPHRAREDGVRC